MLLSRSWWRRSFVMWASLACFLQLTGNPNPIELIVQVNIGSFREHAGPMITIQLLDGFGTLRQELKTDSTGRAEFHTFAGMHRLRIYGPGIQEYEATLDLDRGQTRHIENVVLQPDKSAPAALNTVPGSAVVPAARLKIPEKARVEFESGSAALEKKDWAEAKKRFEAAIAIYADYDVAYNGLGIALSSGDAQAARVAFQKAILINTKFAQAYRNLAKISLAERKFEEADSFLTKSLDLDAQNAWALTYAAYSELNLQKFEEAIAHARKAHALEHKGLASVHVVAAKALEATKQPEAALAEYKLYLQEDPEGKDAARAKQAIARLSAAPGK